MKNIAYKVFVDIWRLTCKYRFQKLDDKEWGNFVSDGYKLFNRYKNTNVEYLFRFLFTAVQSYYEKICKEK